jgi:hypothetical protein
MLKQALSGLDVAEWRGAIDYEIGQLEKLGECWDERSQSTSATESKHATTSGRSANERSISQ